MGCKNGGEQNADEKTELGKSVIDILKEEDPDDKKEEQDKEEVIHNLEYYQKKLEKEKEEELTKYSNSTDYVNDIFKLINEIRQKPNEYANFIEDSMDYITETYDKEKQNKKIIFKKQLNILLETGEPAFRDAAKILKKTEPLEPFLFRNDLCVPLPSVSEINNKNYLKNQIANMRANRKVDAYFKDMIKNPEISALLLIVDDNGENNGKRRDIILRKEIKYVGISAGVVGDYFVAYFAFSR